MQLECNSISNSNLSEIRSIRVQCESKKSATCTQLERKYLQFSISEIFERNLSVIRAQLKHNMSAIRMQFECNLDTISAQLWNKLQLNLIFETVTVIRAQCECN